MSQVQEIKERLDIEDVVGSYLKLEKAGKNFKGLCPFHNERSPSFFVSPDRSTYHCFGCSRGGDIFSFVEEIEGLDFVGALKILAERAGVELRPENKQASTEREQLFEMLELSTRFFQSTIVKNKPALAYLLKRGLTMETIKDFRVGFAEDSWDGLLKFLSQQGYRPADMEKAGLVIRSDKVGSNPYYDRFRKRIIFPIADSSGRVVGYSGRIFGEADNEAIGAKYVNTPETELYHKSRILFGFDKAKMEIREKNQAVLVEGQMDLLMSHQAGVKNTVAVSGTSLTEEHVALIKRFAQKIILALDGDSAGVSASDRGVGIAQSAELDVLVAELPKGSDPADIVRVNPEKWVETLAGAKNYIRFRLDILKRDADNTELGANIKEVIFPHIAKLYGGIRKDRALAEVAETLQVSYDAMREEFETWRKKQRQMAQPMSGIGTPPDSPNSTSVKSRKDRVTRKILGILIWQKGLAQQSIDVAECEKQYQTILKNYPLIIQETLTTEQEKELCFEAEVFGEGSEDLAGEVADLLRILEIEILSEQLGSMSSKLRSAQQDDTSVEKLMKEYQGFSKRREELKNQMQT